MTIKLCRILGHVQIINKMEKYSTPAYDEFWAKLAAILDFDPFILRKLFKTYSIVSVTLKNIYIDTNIVIL